MAEIISALLFCKNLKFDSWKSDGDEIIQVTGKINNKEKREENEISIIINI